MTPTDRVDSLLRRTGGHPSAGDLRQMVEEAEGGVLDFLATWCEAQSAACEAEDCDVCGGYVNAAHKARALARERK